MFHLGREEGEGRGESEERVCRKWGEVGKRECAKKWGEGRRERAKSGEIMKGEYAERRESVQKVGNGWRERGEGGKWKMCGEGDVMEEYGMLRGEEDE